jgi:thioredoxin-dependent peroxiredoxin
MAVLIALAVVIVIAVFLWVHDRRINRKRPRPGDAAPSFSLADQNGTARTLGEFQGRPLVLYFYPRDDTPGCAEQAMRFRDSMREFETLGAAVCGVSVNSSQSHAAFALKYKLRFPLLSDRTGAVTARYGSLRDFGFFKIAKRNTFLIDARGKVVKVYLGVNAGRNAREVLDDLRRTPSP